MTKSEELNIQKHSNLSEEVTKTIQSAANYCYNCNRCNLVCPVNHLGIFEPRALLNDLQFLPLDEVLERHNIWACLSCGLCSEYCPMTKDQAGVNFTKIIKSTNSGNCGFNSLVFKQTH